MLPMILKIADKMTIHGESLMKGYEGQIDVLYLNHGLDMPMLADKSSNSRTSGRCVHQDFECVMRLNKAYPKLMEACAKGTNLGKVELSVVKMSEGKISEVAKYELTDTYVASLTLVPQDNGPDGAPQVSSAESLPSVKCRLNYQSLAVTYTEYDEKGAQKGKVSCPAVTGLGS